MTRLHILYLAAYLLMGLGFVGLLHANPHMQKRRTKIISIFNWPLLLLVTGAGGLFVGISSGIRYAILLLVVSMRRSAASQAKKGA